MKRLNLRVINEDQRETAIIATNLLTAPPVHMLAAVFEQCPDCIKIITPDGYLRYMNYNGRCAMGIDDLARYIGKPWWSLWPEEAENLIKGALDVANSGRGSTFTAVCLTAKGQPKWWDVRVSPVVDEHGTVTSIVSISRDVTNTVKDRERLETMALEMRHRMRNAYTLSGALATAAARDEPASHDFAQSLTRRYAILAAVQGKLLDLSTKTTLRQILTEIGESVAMFGRSVAIAEMPDAQIGEDAARAIALILGELATNSIKHGAMNVGGSVSITSAKTRDELVIEWHETKPDAPDMPHPSGNGSGLTLMKRMASSLNGSLTYDWTASGLSARLSLPYPPAAEMAGQTAVGSAA